MLFIDIETYATVNVRNVGVYRYVEDPEFQILMAAWSNDLGQNVQVAIGEEEIDLIPGLRDPAVVKVAHNAQFERVCFSRFFGLDTGDYLDPEQWFDTMAVAAEKGYPQKLKDLSKWLVLEEKDSAGTRLINLFCKPNRKGVRTMPEDKPEEWRQFVDYCRQDVVSMVSAYRVLGGFPTEHELALYNVDQRINDRGVRVDLDLARNAVEAADENQMLHELEVSTLTDLDNPNSLPQMLQWIRDSGLKLPDLRAETVEKALERQDLTSVQHRVLELRQELALVASRKYTAVINRTCSDGRLRGEFRFFGAHTGRWAGGGVQLHNLPRYGLDSPAQVESAVLDLSIGLGATPKTLKALVRPLLLGPLAVVDYSAIEARVLAWLAGEEWVLDAFRDGRDIYVETAERMGGLTRFQGKVAVLALGYNGGVNSLRHMGADGSDEQLQFLVNQYRRANPSIVRLWARMEEAFGAGNGTRAGNRVRVDGSGSDRYIVLPSGRSIGYHGVSVRNGRLSFNNPKKPGVRTSTYGGRLTENLTQAVARDVLGEALVRLWGRGYAVVGHVHDEVLVEAQSGQPVIPFNEIRAATVEAPAWAAGLPLDGEGFICSRYRKG